MTPETTDFDLGARYISGRLQAQSTLWKINYQNRIVTAFDPETNTAIERNVGKVNSWGFDGSVGYRPMRELNLIGMLSYTNAKLKDDLLLGTRSYNSASPPTGVVTPLSLDTAARFPTTGTATVDVCADAGKFVVETPKWQFGGRVEHDFRPFSVGIQGKHVGTRFATDVNDVKVKGYNVVDLDARVGLDAIVPVTGLRCSSTCSTCSTSITSATCRPDPPSAQPELRGRVSTRTVSATLNVGF